MKIYNDDCFKILPTIPDSSVDLILIDPPFGIVACEWDKRPDFEKLYSEFNRVLKPNGVFLCFADFKLAADLYALTSFKKWYSHQLIWNKMRSTNQLNAKKRPLQCNELIQVHNKGKVVYFPQKFYGWNKNKEWVFEKPGANSEIVEEPSKYGDWDPGYKRNNLLIKSKDSEIVEKLPVGSSHGIRHRSGGIGELMTGKKDNVFRVALDIREDPGNRYPTTILPFKKGSQRHKYHPTEKPVHLLEFLIKSYSPEGAVVLDCFMGSGSTGVASILTGREFIGVEMNNEYFDVAKKRLEEL